MYEVRLGSLLPGQERHTHLRSNRGNLKRERERERVLCFRSCALVSVDIRIMYMYVCILYC